MMGTGMVEIDGAYLEGGGQIVRTACALSAVVGRPCRVYNIRKARPRPGLRIQHLAGLESLAGFCSGTLEGGHVGSTEIVFIPGEVKEHRMQVSISTAGSVTLVLQTLLLPAIASPVPCSISIRGGATDTYFSPSADYFTGVFLGLIQKAGVRVEAEIRKRGYYPKGGADTEVTVYPGRIRPLQLLDRGALERVFILSAASASLTERRVAERQVLGARRFFNGMGISVEEKVSYHETFSPGSSVCIIAEYQHSILGADTLGKRGKRAESVGEEAARSLLKEMESGACLDRHMADQLLPFMAFGEGESSVTVSEVTDHAKTNMWVTECFVPGKFKVTGNVINWSP